jgi:hypothetical protein
LDLPFRFLAQLARTDLLENDIRGELPDQVGSRSEDLCCAFPFRQRGRGTFRRWKNH